MNLLLRVPFIFLFLFCSLTGITKQVNTIDSLQHVLTQQIHDTDRVNTNLQLAKKFRNTDANKALQYAQEAHALSTGIHYQMGVATSADLMGILYNGFGDYRKALYYHFLSIKIFEKLGYIKGIAFAYNNIGAVHSHLKNYSKSESYYLKSLELKLQNNMQKEASSSYVNLGNLKMYSKQLDACIKYYTMGLTNANKFGDTNNITIALMNLGEAYFDLKKWDIALSYYYKALPIVKRSQNTFHLAQIYYAIGKIFSELNQPEKGEFNLLRALSLAQQEKTRPLELNIYRYLSKHYELVKNYKLALEYNKHYVSLNDSIYNAEENKALSEMQARFDLEKKEEQIKALNQEKIIIQEKERREAIIRNALIVAFLLISVIAFISIRSVIRKQKSNKLLNIKNNHIEWQRKEIEAKNIILAEYNKELLKENVVARYETLKSKINPHFLFNSLSTLSALIIKEPKTALEFVSKFSKLYRSIMEHGNDNLVSIQEELQVLDNFVYLKKMRFGDAIQLSIQIAPQYLDDMIPPFALQLLVENAIKHNFISAAKPLYINISYTGNALKVTNNIQPRETPAPSTGLGQQSILERYQYVSTIAPQFKIEGENYIAIIPTLTQSKLA